MKLAPQWTAASIDIVPSFIACASGSFEVVKLPEQRSGRFSRRASWPITIEPIAGSGVPKVGEPERSDMDDRKLPKITGAPGRSSCASAQPAIVSAKRLGDRPGIGHRPHRAAEDEGHDHRALVGPRIGPQRGRHRRIPHQRRIDVEIAEDDAVLVDEFFAEHDARHVDRILGAVPRPSPSP